MPPPLPTIYVDTREDARPHPDDRSKVIGTDMLKLLLSHRTMPVAEARFLPAGDFCFSGNGPNGPVLIGIERKRMKDMINSIRLGRFSGEQLPKLLGKEEGHYDYAYLVFESRWKTDWLTGNLVEKWGKNWEPVYFGTDRKREPVPGLFLSSFFTSIAATTPLKIIQVEDPRQTVEAVMSLAHVWSKPWTDHKAATALHTPQQFVQLEKASIVRRYAASLPGIGWEKSRVIEEAFPSIESTVHHTERCKECDAMKCTPVTAKEFERLEGFGKVTAKKLVDRIRGVHANGDGE